MVGAERGVIRKDYYWRDTWSEVWEQTRDWVTFPRKRDRVQHKKDCICFFIC